MRRIEQVRIGDWAVRTLVVMTFFAYFVAPSTQGHQNCFRLVAVFILPSAVVA